ncbi:MAG: EamA family transporter, partial [Bdellovibrionota bacterium]
GESLLIGWARFRWLALTGSLLWIGGHALVIWAERRIDSGLAALLFASTPLWAALIVSLRERRWGNLAPVFAGFVGVAIVLPVAGNSAPWFDCAVLLFSAFLWALGTVLGEGPTGGLPIAVSTGIQLGVAGLVTAVVAIAAGEAAPHPGSPALLAGAYLVVFATVVAYLAYSHALRTLPIEWLMSFGYVNPVVAVALGALLLGEAVTPRSLLGMLVVLGAVVWIFAGAAITARKARSAA